MATPLIAVGVAVAVFLVGDLNLMTAINGYPVISILGAGAATTIIDAHQIDRVFKIHDNTTVVMNGITIQNGLTDVDGGGNRT